MLENNIRIQCNNNSVIGEIIVCTYQIDKKSFHKHTTIKTSL